MSWPSDNRRKYSPRGVVAGEPGFAHSGPIVHNQGCYVVVTHYFLLCYKVNVPQPNSFEH